MMHSFPPPPLFFGIPEVRNKSRMKRRIKSPSPLWKMGKESWITMCWRKKSAFIWKSEMEFEITNNVSGTGADWATRLFHWPHNQSHVWTDSLSKLSPVVLLSENLEKLWVAPGVSLNLKKTVSVSWLNEIITMSQRDFYKWMQRI